MTTKTKIWIIAGVVIVIAVPVIVLAARKKTAVAPGVSGNAAGTAPVDLNRPVPVGNSPYADVSPGFQPLAALAPTPIYSRGTSVRLRSSPSSANENNIYAIIPKSGTLLGYSSDVVDDADGALDGNGNVYQWAFVELAPGGPSVVKQPFYVRNDLTTV